MKVTMIQELYPESMNISQELFTWLLEQKENLKRNIIDINR
jgi:hypothetical protein